MQRRTGKNLPVFSKVWSGDYLLHQIERDWNQRSHSQDLIRTWGIDVSPDRVKCYDSFIRSGEEIRTNFFWWWRFSFQSLVFFRTSLCMQNVVSHTYRHLRELNTHASHSSFTRTWCSFQFFSSNCSFNLSGSSILIFLNLR